MNDKILFVFHDVTERNTEDQSDPDLNSECTTCTGTGHTQGPQGTPGVQGVRAQRK